MSQVFFIRIDLDKLREALDAPAALALTNDDLFDWLLDRGLRIGMKGWYAEDKAINRIHPSVIVSCDRVA